MRQLFVWRLMFSRRPRTSSSATTPSDETTAAVPTVYAATSRRPHLTTGQHRHNSRWTTPSAPPGNARNRPTESRAQRTRRIVGDIAAVIVMVCAMFLLLGGIIVLASMIGDTW